MEEDLAANKAQQDVMANVIDQDAERAYREMLQKSQFSDQNVDDEFESAFDNTNAVETSADLRVEPVENTGVRYKDYKQGDQGSVSNKTKLNREERATDDETTFTPKCDGDQIRSENSGHPVNSQKASALSPSNSVYSHPSSTSSDPSWPTDLRSSLPQDRRVKPHKTQSLEEAQEEWEQVETVTAGSKAEGYCSPMVNTQEALASFEVANLGEYANKIKPTIKKSGLSSLWHMISGPPNIANSLKKDRDMVFTLGLCPFENQNKMHCLILQTVYKKLTTTTLDCPRYGSHWEAVGFQGEDPSTDLRGCGMLGLLNILFLCTDHKTQALCRDIYRLSQDEEQNFPFCVMGINITRIALQILREGKLNKECNQRNAVFEVFHELYAAIYLGIYRIWKTQQKTISDSGFVLRDIEIAAKKTPLVFCKQLQKTLQERNKLSESPVSSKAKGSTAAKVDKFSGICDGGDDEEEEVHLV